MTIQVGAKHPFPAAVFQGAQLYLEPLVFIVGLAEVTTAETVAFQLGRLDLYLREIEDLISLVVFVKGLGWSEALFAMQSTGSAELSLPPEDPTQGYAVAVVLVDTVTQTVKAQRLIGVSQEFSRGLYELWLRHRNDAPLSRTEFNKRGSAIMQRFSSPEELVAGAHLRYSTAPQ